jgi:exopolysaccharide production protein ExoY
MRPGLTGAWAVSGRHGVGYPERAEIELSYIRNWSVTTDLVVLAKTLRAVLSY